MSTKTITRIGTSLAIVAAATLATTGCANMKGSSSKHMVKCHGANSCKGKSACMTAHNKCKGHNSCKGKGFVKMSKQACKKAGGTIGK